MKHKVEPLLECIVLYGGDQFGASNVIGKPPVVWMNF